MKNNITTEKVNTRDPGNLTSQNPRPGPQNGGRKLKTFDFHYKENLFQNVNKNPSHGHVTKLNQARCCYSIENESKKTGAVASPGEHENVRKRELFMTVSALILRDALNLTSSA